MLQTIVLMTATGAENLGDELITLCEIQQFQREQPEKNILLFSHDPKRTWRFLRAQNIQEKGLTILPYFPTHIRSHPFKNIWYCIQTCVTFFQASHIYIGGGGLFYRSDEEGHSPLRLWCMRARIVKLLRKPLTYLSLGISTKKEELQKYAHGLFQHATITVRDQESQERVHEAGYAATIVPDPVFSYVSKRRKQEHKEITVGIALRSGFIPDGIVSTIVRELVKKEYIVYLLPHSLHPDDTASHDGYYLQKFLFPGVKITQTIEQTLATYELCDVIIGMRLHSSILASVMGIPLIALSYSTKTRSILTQMHHEFIDTQAVTAENILTKITSIVHP